MKTNNKQIINTFYGVILVSFFALIATIISEVGFFKKLGISPLIIGIVLGIFYANSLKSKFSKIFQDGIIFSTKNILRLGIILYGFRLTFQNLQEVGLNGILVAFCIVFFTFIFGYIIGTKFLKMDKELAEHVQEQETQLPVEFLETQKEELIDEAYNIMAERNAIENETLIPNPSIEEFNKDKAIAELKKLLEEKEKKIEELAIEIPKRKKFFGIF